MTLPFRRKSYSGILCSEKTHRLWLGLNLRTLDPVASMITTVPSGLTLATRFEGRVEEWDAMKSLYWRSMNNKGSGRPCLSHHQRGWWNETKWVRWVWRNGGMKFVIGRNPKKNLPKPCFVHHKTHIEWPRRKLGTPVMGGKHLTACATSLPQTLNLFRMELVNLNLFHSGQQSLECLSSLAVSIHCCDSSSSKISSEMAASCRERFPWKARAHSEPLGVTRNNTRQCILRAACVSMVDS